jgi:hypothetical protein
MLAPEFSPRLPCLHSPPFLCQHQEPLQLSTQRLQCNNKMSERIRTHREDERTRDSRSRSPRREPTHSRRTRSPHRHHHKRKHSPEAAPKELPYNSRQLTKRDFDNFKPLFALYLDIQKGKVLDELDEVEVKGRWKSFLGKW